MCRQTSNGLISIPSNEKHIESNENMIETITNLIEKNAKPCVKNCLLIEENFFDFLLRSLLLSLSQSSI